MTFTNETVSVVVGGTSGIGRAVAESLETRPGRVEIASRSTGLDIADEGAVRAFFEMLSPIDNVVITAGSSAPGGAVTDVSINDAMAAFGVKFWGSVIAAREAAKQMRPGRDDHADLRLSGAAHGSRHLCQNRDERGAGGHDKSAG